MKMTLVNINQSLFCLVFSKYLKQSCIKDVNILSEHNVLYQKQFGSRQDHSMENAIMQLIDQINDKLENNCFTSGILIDFSKAFDTVNHYKLFHFHLSFLLWRVWKGMGKITKNWISQEQKELFR